MHDGERSLPHALTEQGIMMLFSFLTVILQLHIIDALGAMKKYISSTLVNQNFINTYKNCKNQFSIKEASKYI